MIRLFPATLLALCVIAGLSSPALPTNDEIKLTFSFDVGQKFAIELTKERIVNQPGEPPNATSGTVPVSAEVIEKRDDEYVLRWTFGKALISTSATPDKRPGVPSISALDLGMRFPDRILEFRANADGVPIEVNGLAALKTKVRFLLEALNWDHRMEIYWKKEWDIPDERLHALLLNDANRLYGLGGLVIKPDEVLEYDYEYYSQYQEYALPAVETISVASYSSATNEATLLSNVSLSEEHVEELAFNSINGMLASSGISLPAEKLVQTREQLKNFSIDLTERTTYVVDLKHQIVKHLEFERKVSIDNHYVATDRIVFSVSILP